MRTNQNKSNCRNCRSAETVESALTYERENRFKWLRKNLKFGQNILYRIEWSQVPFLTSSHKTLNINQATNSGKIQQTCVRARKSAPPQVLSNLISMSFYTNSHLQPSKPLRFSLLQALERAPISLGNSFPIHSSPHFPCKLNHLSFQLASPPSIHMRSWWAVCNLRQSPK